MKEKIMVGMAELKVAKSPDILTTIALGSCLGICLYDRKHKVAGLAHAMLPYSSNNINNDNRYKFVDTATEFLIEEMLRYGAEKPYITAKLVGGAQMFEYITANESMKIGDRNVEAAHKILGELNIHILAEDIKNNYGRTVIFYSENGNVEVKSIGKDKIII